MKLISHSPLALPFEKAIQPSEFLLQIRRSAESDVLADLAKRGGREFGLAIAGARVILDKGTVQVVFKNGIPAGAKLMKSAGAQLPKLVDGRTGRILEVGRVASKGRAVASVAANAALIVVEAAHMISGHDNAKRLKLVERSVERLVLAHESALKARLEAIYRFSKELHHGTGPLSEEDKRELHRQCRDLFHLRAQWRDDFRHRLATVERAEAGWFNKILWWTRENAERQGRQTKAKESMDALEIVQLMQFSLMLQMSLASSAGKLDAFLHATLPDECRQWRDLADFGRQRAREIASGDEGKEFIDFLGHLNDVAGYWEILNREKQPPQITRRSRGR